MSMRSREVGFGNLGIVYNDPSTIANAQRYLDSMPTPTQSPSLLRILTHPVQTYREIRELIKSQASLRA